MKKRIDSFRYAFQGVADGLKAQVNFRIHLVCAAVAIVLGAIVGLSRVEWCVILFCCGLVISLELLNTALEKLCDVVEPNKNEKIRVVKDMSAAAVLFAAITALVIGLIIFIPKTGAVKIFSGG
jgi:undecaprenol kinase/diacylglycerol kinase (ATP)